MKSKIIFLGVLALIGLYGCTKYWEDHYTIYPETVDINLWDALNEDPDITEFVQVLKEFQYDTLIFSDDTYTIFVPGNDALTDFIAENEMDTTQLNYLISSYFLQSEDIGVKRKIQTLGRKFALLEKNGGNLRFDGIPVGMESPLYRNGKYFVLESVAEPKPNLYEYFVENNPRLSSYISSLDSIILDKENSTPVGFDENGNTVYDTVSIIYNEFYENYFHVNREFRNKTATIVFPKQESYQPALTEMAVNLKIPGYTDYSHIPIDWQERILIPFLLNQGVFENMLEPEEFMKPSELDTLKLKNIKGDTIPILYTPVNKTLCSNGYVYNYQDFKIPDSLYLGPTTVEAEWLLQQTGKNKFSWKEEVNVKSDEAFEVSRVANSTASNDSIVSVLFPANYRGEFSLEFYTESLFPQKYLMVVRTNMYYGGVYDIYVNDELVKTFDYFDFILSLSDGYMTSVTGERYFPEGVYNKFDMWVDNVSEYGRAKIRFEYKSPGFITDNGLIIDYIEFIPAKQLP